jgi:hypothetical protein
MKLTRAWHLFITENGERADRGGKPITVGIDPHGRVQLAGEALRVDGTPLSDEAAAWLSAALAAAIRPGAYADSYEAACTRFDRATAAAPRARADAERIRQDAEDEWEAARANLAKFERSPGIPLPEHDPLTAWPTEPAPPFTAVPRLRRVGSDDAWPAGLGRLEGQLEIGDADPWPAADD